MKKTIISIVIMAFAATCLIGCSSGETTQGSVTEATSTAEMTTTTTTEATTTTTTEATTTETTISRTVSVTPDELEELLVKQPAYISSTKYLVQDKNYKTLYPDMLQAVIKNNSEDDIKDAVVIFVAWDENNLPVKIKGQFDYSDGEYLMKCKYSGINLVPGKEYGKDGGMEIDDGLNIKKFKAIVYEYETFEGKKWTNPYYHAWAAMYDGGKKLKDDLTADAYLTDSDYEELVNKSKETTVDDGESSQSVDSGT